MLTASLDARRAWQSLRRRAASSKLGDDVDDRSGRRHCRWSTDTCRGSRQPWHSGTVVVPVASFVAVATLRRLASALQSTHLRLGDAAGMGTAYPSRALSTSAMKLCCSSLCRGQSLPMSDDFGVCFAELGIRRSTVLSIVLRQMAAT